MGDRGIKEPINFLIGPEDEITEKEKFLQGVLFVISGEFNYMKFGTERAYKLDELIRQARDINGVVNIKDLHKIYKEIATEDDVKTYIKFNIQDIARCLKRKIIRV